jgi:catechol 2,3-dioxygenase-like lactoylglutathione lyase family enzyme
MSELGWYLADVVVRVSVEAVHVNTHLVRADSPGEAYAKAVELGEDSDGEFLGLAGLNVIHEPLDDGAEIAFTERRGLSDRQVLALVVPREQLAAFEPLERAAPAPSVIGIDHAQIMIAPGEEGAVRAFYCGLLGFEELAKPERLLVRGGFWLQAGDRQLHVGVEAHGPGIDRRATRAHLAYQVVGLDAFRARLAEAGVAILDREPLAGQRRCELRDPAGNRVELLERV